MADDSPTLLKGKPSGHKYVAWGRWASSWATPAAKAALSWAGSGWTKNGRAEWFGASKLTSFAAPHGAFSPLGTAGAEWDGAPKAAMAKMVATENAQRVIDRAVQLHRGQGVRKGSMVECLYREIRALRVCVGATEVQRLNIGKGLLGD